VKIRSLRRKTGCRLNQRGLAEGFFSQGFLRQQKGFVGPIGDDIPSLIPLTIALLIFFSAFAFAFNSYEEKKAEFDQRLLLLSIGKTLKGDNLLDSYQKWSDACNNLEVTRYKFRAVVFLVSTKPNAEFHNYEFFSDWQESYNDNPSSGYNASDPYTWIDDDRIYNFNASDQLLRCENTDEEITSSKALAQKTLRISFPVAVSKEDVFRPAILTVMVWNT
jgi:hypothetical protein